MEFLKPENYQDRAKKIFGELKVRIQSAIPDAHVEHIGSSVIPNAISKGDLDVFVGTTKSDFSVSLNELQRLGFKIKEDTLRTPELCMLECFDFDIEVGIQLVDMKSTHVDFLTFKNRMLSNPDLVDRYNQLKTDSVGSSHEEYRSKKSDFIEKVLAE